jgi:hypothetical protein
MPSKNNRKPKGRAHPYKRTASRSGVSGNNSGNRRATSDGVVWVGTTNPPRVINSDRQTYQIVQASGETTFSQVAVTFATGAVAFQFAYLPQASQLSAVFDQYKFDWVEATFRPLYNSNPMTESGSSIAVPTLYTVVDYDDSTTTASAAFFQQYANCTQSVYEMVYRRFQPHVAVATYQSSTFSSYTNMAATWIDCATPTTQHYGLKWGCDGGSAGQTSLQQWQISYRFCLSFRSVR